jgi:hypothetical protein
MWTARTVALMSDSTSGQAADASSTAALSPDEKAAVRAFLQRCDVRLSTMHRVATALLSGAGILVVLPAVERDSVLTVLRSLLAGPVTWSRGFLGVGVVLTIALALEVLWLLIIELTRFYFHANHVVHEGGEAFTPRFTLTGLRVPTDEFTDETNALYDRLHGAESTVRLLVPENSRARRRIDRQIAAYPGLLEDHGDPDLARADALFELAASRRRTLLEEAAKVEYGMVRHMLRLQVIVLRYVKALLVVVITSISAFALAASVSGQSAATAADQRWIAGILLIWAPVVLNVVSSPVRWLESLLRTEGAMKAAVRDHELTQLEDVTARVAGVAWLVSMIGMIVLLVHHPISSQGRVGVIGVIGMSVALSLRSARQRWERHRPVKVR